MVDFIPPLLLLCGFLIFGFVFFCSPGTEGFDGVRVGYVDAGDGAFGFRLIEFVVDELVAEVDGVGIFFGVSIIYARHSCPVKRTEAHRARLARTVDVAAVELERA